MENKRAEDTERRVRAKIDTEAGKKAAIRTDEEVARDAIAMEGEWSDEEKVFIPPTKLWNRRPPHWRSVGQYALKNGVGKTFIDHMDDFTCSRETALHQIYRWMHDVKTNKVPTIARAPIYGTTIDNELLDSFKTRQVAGLSVNCIDLRLLLLPILEKHGKSALAEKPNSFGSSWAKRFFKRHKISWNSCNE